MSTSFISYENQICPHWFFLIFTISGSYCDWNLNKPAPLPTNFGKFEKYLRDGQVNDLNQTKQPSIFLITA